MASRAGAVASRAAAVVDSPPYPSPTADQLAALSGVSTRLVGGFDPGTSLAFGTGPGIGSNNWVIAGSRTASGKPLLANDPHLGIQMPSIWEEVDLYCSAQDAERFRRHLQSVGLPTAISDIPGPRPTPEALIAAMGHDKKVKGGRLTFILLHGLGEAFVTTDVPPDAVKDVLSA